MQGSTRAKLLRQQLTNAEQTLWYQLRDRRLSNCKFRRQMPIGQYVADFVCMSARLIIELDGRQHTNRIDHDQRRTTFLRKEGFEVIRFWNNELLQNIEGVLITILIGLKKREAPSP